MITKGTWEKAQKLELSSWLNTDIQYEDLFQNWLNKKKELSYVLKGVSVDSKLLDVGSGPVSFLTVIPDAEKKVALDPLNNEYGKKFRRDKSIKYKTLKSENLTFRDNYFDVVFCINTLDHVEDYKKSLFEMIRVLKKEGLLYLEYENTSPLIRHLSRIGYKKHLADFHPHILSNKNIIRLCKENNLEIVIISLEPQFTFDKIKYLAKLLFGRKELTAYEKMISSTSSGFLKFVMHNLLIIIERLLYSFDPLGFAYFTKLALKKH